MWEIILGGTEWYGGNAKSDCFMNPPNILILIDFVQDFDRNLSKFTSPDLGFTRYLGWLEGKVGVYSQMTFCFSSCVE